MNYEEEVKKVRPNANLDYLVDGHCDSYYFICDGQHIISRQVPHDSEYPWQSAYSILKQRGEIK